MLHHRKHNRMPGFDYTHDRLYFITSCVKDRACAFGDIVPLDPNNKGLLKIHSQTATHQMILNPCGMIARQQWYWLERQYPYVRLHAFIVMPNHIHGILEINRDLLYDVRLEPVGTGRDLSLPVPIIDVPIIIDPSADNPTMDVHSNHLDVHTNHRDVHTNHRDVHTNHRDVHTNHRDVRSEHRDVRDDHQDVHTDHRDIHTNHRDVRLEQVGTGRDLSLPVPIKDVPIIIDPSVDNPTMDFPTNQDPIITDSSTSSPSIFQPGNKIKSLSELIGAYKTTSSKLIRMWQAPDGSYPYKDFQWQRSFHDHIIWNKEEYDHITFYIHNNPSAWFKDMFFQ